MTQQAQRQQVSEVRAIAGQVARQQPVPQDFVEAGRGSLQAMFQDAAAYGFTEADVIKAVLGPAFEEERGCDCPACKSRRSMANEQQLQRWQSQSGDSGSWELAVTKTSPRRLPPPPRPWRPRLLFRPRQYRRWRPLL